MNFLVNDVYSYSNEHKMTLNPTKCNCIVVDFLYYNSCAWSPIFIGNTAVERVRTFKVLGVTISDDLKWDSHCDIVVGKANKRLYMPYVS